MEKHTCPMTLMSPPGHPKTCRGSHLAAACPGAVEAARKLKPQIPRVGQYGIPIRDELEFRRPS
jgi:hypothetical protein